MPKHGEVILAQPAASWYHTLEKHTGKLEDGERRLPEVRMANSIDDVVEYQATSWEPVGGSQDEDQICDDKKD
jgi:hypothetical protein